MFNPEFIYINQENTKEDAAVFISYQVFTTIFNRCMIIVLCCIALLMCKTIINVIMPLGLALIYTMTSFWGILTPGNQIFELGLIIISIIMLVLVTITMSETATQLDNLFIKLKCQCKEKDQTINELEKEIARLSQLVVTTKEETTLDTIIKMVEQENTVIKNKDQRINELETEVARLTLLGVTTKEETTLINLQDTIITMMNMDNGNKEQRINESETKTEETETEETETGNKNRRNKNRRNKNRRNKYRVAIWGMQLCRM